MPTSYTWNAEPSTRSRISRSDWNLELRDRWDEMRSFEELPADWDLIFDIRSVVLRRLLRLRTRQQKLVIKFLAIKYSCRNVLVVSGAILALLTTSRAVFVLWLRSFPFSREHARFSWFSGTISGSILSNSIWRPCKNMVTMFMHFTSTSLVRRPTTSHRKLDRGMTDG